MKKYEPKKIEPKWQKYWEDKNYHQTPDEVKGKDNEYILFEFPYPSGNLHVGHWYAYSVTDIYVRYRRMLGKNVLFPIGFDAFGLPAENAAIKNKLNPREWTYSNIDYMRKQIKRMGASLDWSREIISADPDYYKWTQWLFLKFLEKDLAYQSETPVNWCPSCKTVLANEQVTSGKCERCGSEVVQKNMNQWQLKITNYADRLLSDLEPLDYPQPIKDAQINWIGKSTGAEIEFKIKGKDLGVKVFTTRPDTIFGATYLVIAPENKIILDLEEDISNFTEVEKYIKETRKKTELERQENKEKTGIELKGIKAINPASNEEIPVWIADYVLGGYGTGSIMAVPAHDDRDFEFAKKFDLPIKQVVSGDKKLPFAEDGLLINSGEFGGKDSKEVRAEITKFVLGEEKTKYKIRDWVISRQRYWGCPIPVIHCEKCGTVPVPEKDLPVVLPEIDDYLPTGDGKSPLAKASDWVNVKCPECNGEAERETDTFDTFIDSSWYFLRYADPKNQKEFASKEKLKKWIPVDFYSGGAEHTTMHLLYSRFFHKALFDMGLVNEPEPYKKRLNRGLILGPDGNKMSKSKGNVVDPDEYVSSLGADTVRTYLAFIGPYNEIGSYPWNPDGIIGARRFLERVWRLSDEQVGSGELEEVLVHKTIKNVTEIIDRLKLNTAVAALMEFLNVAEKKGLTKEQMEVFLKLLAPFAPHISEEIWSNLGKKNSIFEESWPEYDLDKTIDENVTFVVQINGKTKTTFEGKIGMEKDEVFEKAMSLPQVKDKVQGKKPKKIVYVSNKLINIVI